MNREIIFQKDALKEYTEWKKKDPKVAGRIKQLIEAILEQPFEGIGKPEPLKHQLAGYWSRRITKEHRLVYKVTDKDIIIVACKYHY
ncbi:MAG: Txe/YoeB family addiction module toxin [Flavobacteriales bacterium]|nr:Txe/YoeB family addiction module toxin [Flavobacteriales bacterium]